jgi:hypothetical protein
MSDEAWNSGNPLVMLDYLGRGTPSDRKLRLFACQCARRVWPLLGPQSRTAVAITEKYADDAASDTELAEAHASATEAFHEAIGKYASPAESFRDALAAAARTVWSASADWSTSLDPQLAGSTFHVFGVLSSAIRAATLATMKDVSSLKEPGDVIRHVNPVELAAQAAVLRDLFGPQPLAGIRAAQSLLNQQAVTFAGQVYEERILPEGKLDGHRLTELSHAIESSGAQAEMLSHLREHSSHWRGCWVVDLLLGKL